MAAFMNGNVSFHTHHIASQYLFDNPTYRPILDALQFGKDNPQNLIPLTSDPYYAAKFGVTVHSGGT
jgi:hypothetical protein